MTNRTTCWRVTLLATLGALTLALAACSGDDDPTATPTPGDGDRIEVEAPVESFELPTPGEIDWRVIIGLLLLAALLIAMWLGSRHT